MEQRMVAISADTHVGNVFVNFEPWIDPPMRERYREHRKSLFSDANRAKALSRNEQAGRSDDIFDLRELFPGETVLEQIEERRRFLSKHTGRSDGLTGMMTGGESDPERRLRELEGDGTVGDVLMSQVSPFISYSYDPELTPANTMALNRWMVDFVSHHPERHAGSIVPPLGGPIEEVVRQIRWSRAHGLRGGLQLTTSPEIDGLPLFSHKYYEPMWSVCEELDVPLLIHGGTGAMPPKAGGTAIWLMERHWFHMRPLKYFIFGGVLERHPGLKVVFIETSACWVNGELKRLDELYEGRPEGGSITRTHNPHMAHVLSGIRKILPRKPSEYFRSNCYVGLGAWPACWAARHDIGIDNIVWGSDYPHNEASWPKSMEQIRETTTELNVPREDVRKILGTNAARIWGFDLAKLQPVAERVGPSF
jgi:predicted TIM-barrel fold metal-dependent hydrolase